MIPPKNECDALKRISPRSVNNRPWWVCGYGKGERERFHWRIYEVPWEGGVRTLNLLEVKTFKTYEEAIGSRAYLRGYAPFVRKHTYTLLLRSVTVRNAIVQWRVNDDPL